MIINDLTALLPFIIITATSIAVMLFIAFYRSHRLTAIFTITGLAFAVASLPAISSLSPRQITPLIIIDGFAIFYMGIILSAALIVAALSYSYLEKHAGHHEEFYLLLLIATLGTAVLAASAHFASFFLGIEILSVSLYALSAYQRHNDRSVEAGVKYLILAALSSAFILFGMALVYAETGSLEFGKIAAGIAHQEARRLPLIAGFVMIITGLGFKLAVVPFHMWTPDIYEGAPAPVTAFIATVSKGAVFALVLRYFTRIDFHAYDILLLIFTIIAVASMFTGNLLALMQTNVKRILAYSSIAHMGYLLVAFLAAGPLRITAATFYLTAYFVTTLGAFGVVAVLSHKDRDADDLNDYVGLAWRKPWLAAVFTAMLLSLAGIPLTAGFIAKFYLVAAGVGSTLWLLVIALLINSALGLYYYLRIIAAVYSQATITSAQTLSLSDGIVLAGLTILLLWLGVYPDPLITLIQNTVQTLM